MVICVGDIMVSFHFIDCGSFCGDLCYERFPTFLTHLLDLNEGLNCTESCFLLVFRFRLYDQVSWLIVGILLSNIAAIYTICHKLLIIFPFFFFGQFRTHKVIYRRYAGLFFSLCVDITDNELAYLESIHLFVEILDHFFSNVCELDLVFNFHKVCTFFWFSDVTTSQMYQLKLLILSLKFRAS